MPAPRTTNTEDLSNWTLTNYQGVGHQFVFPAGITMPPGTFLVVCSDTVAVHAHYGAIGPVTGNFTFAMRNSAAGDNIVLRRGDGTLVDSVSYVGASPWPHETSFHTIEVTHSDQGNNDYRNWHLSSVVGGTPGRANSTALGVDSPLRTAPQVVSAYPNPTRGVISLGSALAGQIITIARADGRVVARVTVDATGRIDLSKLSGLATGMVWVGSERVVYLGR